MNSRIENVGRNASVAIVTQILNLVVSFINRSFFIYILGVEYLGVNGLFSNVLLLLSFAELGIGNAITYSMYKPLAENNTELIKSLMQLYKKTYQKISIIVLFIGVLLIPFLLEIIGEVPSIKENIYVIYCLFLINTSCSYLFVYKKSIVIADQKSYLVSFYNQLIQLAKVLLQVVILIKTKNYLLVLMIQIAATLFSNFALATKANKLYPFLKDKQIAILDNRIRRDIFKNIKALFLYKLGSVILNGTDNIIISIILGVSVVGYSSNYIMIVAAIISVTGQIMNSFTASVGNLNAIGKGEDKERIFNFIFFISSWIYGFCSICLLLLTNNFIAVWLGSEFVLSEWVLLTIVIHFYINSVHFAAYTYRVTMGLFVQGKYTPIIASILNIVLSILLGNWIGLGGIFLATSISRFFTTGIVDPVLIYIKGFNKNPVTYYVNYFKHVIIYILFYVILRNICIFVSFEGITDIIIEGIIIFIFFNTFMVLIHKRGSNYILLKKSIKLFVGNKLGLNIMLLKANKRENKNEEI